MKTMRILPVMALALTSVLVSCSKDGDKAEPAAEGYALTFKTDAEQSTQAERWTINQATAMVTEVELESEGSDEYEVELEGRYRVDLLTGKSTPEMPMVRKDAGAYTELELTLGDDDRPNDTALFVDATYNDGNQDYDVLIVLDGELEFEVEDEGGILIQSNQITQLELKLAIEKALAETDMSTYLNAGLVIRIDKTTNASLMADIKNRLVVEIDD